LLLPKRHKPTHHNALPPIHIRNHAENTKEIEVKGEIPLPLHDISAQLRQLSSTFLQMALVASSTGRTITFRDTSMPTM
jgi:hypothetical protein